MDFETLKVDERDERDLVIFAKHGAEIIRRCKLKSLKTKMRSKRAKERREGKKDEADLCGEQTHEQTREKGRQKEVENDSAIKFKMCFRSNAAENEALGGVER